MEIHKTILKLEDAIEEKNRETAANAGADS